MLGVLNIASGAAGVTEVTLRASDEGELSDTQVVEISVYQGPKLKADAPEKVTFSLSSALGAVADATANTIDLDGTFVTIATKGPKDEVEDNGDTANAPDDANYGPDAADDDDVASSNPAVATAMADDDSGLVTVLARSLGTTTLKIPVTQQTGPGATEDFSTEAPATGFMRF